jgi:hypothetical protein
MVFSFFLKRFYFISDTIGKRRSHQQRYGIYGEKGGDACGHKAAFFRRRKNAVNAVTLLMRSSLSGASFSAAYMFFVSLYKEKTLP